MKSLKKINLLNSLNKAHTLGFHCIYVVVHARSDCGLQFISLEMSKQHTTHNYMFHNISQCTPTSSHQLNTVLSTIKLIIKYYMISFVYQLPSTLQYFSVSLLPVSQTDCFIDLLFIEPIKVTLLYPTYDINLRLLCSVFLEEKFMGWEEGRGREKLK